MALLKKARNPAETQKWDKELSLSRADCLLDQGTEAVNVLSLGVIILLCWLIRMHVAVVPSLFMHNTVQLGKINLAESRYLHPNTSTSNGVDSHTLLEFDPNTT